MWKFFQILTHSNFRQTNATNMKSFVEALCLEYYKQIKEFSKIHQIP